MSEFTEFTKAASGAICNGNLTRRSFVATSPLSLVGYNQLISSTWLHCVSILSSISFGSFSLAPISFRNFQR